jgi:hypothetical protein
MLSWLIGTMEHAQRVESEFGTFGNSALGHWTATKKEELKMSNRGGVFGVAKKKSLIAQRD